MSSGSSVTFCKSMRGMEETTSRSTASPCMVVFPVKNQMQKIPNKSAAASKNFLHFFILSTFLFERTIESTALAKQPPSNRSLPENQPAFIACSYFYFSRNFSKRPPSVILFHRTEPNGYKKCRPSFPHLGPQGGAVHSSSNCSTTTRPSARVRFRSITRWLLLPRKRSVKSRLSCS